ncbi:achaete-scute homolog 1a-like [Pecten maximus]|uniref:achaete-scute homolog 1a-like n=1 Tax=Pecten maximus TaxID=6579 RepID=UPI001458A3AF|nr:achaete-scute homolog 1a-like [Pecten maximus]
MVNTLQNMFENSLFGQCQYSCPEIKYKTRKRRHVPHSQRSPEYVLHRNNRERKRVEALNDAFQLLGKHVPFIAETDDRASKAGILYGAARYIRVLADILDDTSSSKSSRSDVNENILLGRQDTSSWYDNHNKNISGDQETLHHCQPQSQENSPNETCMFMEIQHCPPTDYQHYQENVPPHIPDPRDCLYTPTGLLWR